MTVVRLSDGTLWVHSPVQLDGALREDLRTLGPVRFVVAPNRYHHLYVGDYFGAYPAAQLYAAPGLQEKRPDLSFHGRLGDQPAAGWAGQIDQVLFPLPILNDVVFCHRASRTLIVTDLVFNVRDHPSRLTRLVFRFENAYGRLAPIRTWRLLIRNHAAAAAAIDRILAWDFDRVIVTHGEVLASGGRDAVRSAFAWL